MPKCNFKIALLLSLCLAISYNSYAVFRDPTQPAVAETIAAPNGKYHLNSVFISGSKQLAIINGKMAQVGDTIDGATVISIDKDKVVLETQGASFTVYLPTYGLKH